MGYSVACRSFSFRINGAWYRGIYRGAGDNPDGENGLASENGAVIVTGATGGVGGLAVDMLADTLDIGLQR